MESTNTAILGCNIPTQMHIKLPSLPSLPSPIFGSKHMSSGYSSGTASKHTLLLPLHPMPPSPSPATSCCQSGAPYIHLHHHSACGLSIASTSSFKVGTLKSTLPLLQFTPNGSPLALHFSSVFSVQECTGDSVYTSGVWTHACGLVQVDVLSSFVCNMMMDAWQEDQVYRMKVHATLAPGHCHAHTVSVAPRQHATHGVPV